MFATENLHIAILLTAGKALMKISPTRHLGIAHGRTMTDKWILSCFHKGTALKIAFPAMKVFMASITYVNSLTGNEKEHTCAVISV